MSDHETNLPGPGSRFALAHQRLAQADAARMAWLDQQCGQADPDEETEPLPAGPRDCPCGCGEPIAKPKTSDRWPSRMLGKAPKYASAACRYRVRDQRRASR